MIVAVQDANILIDLELSGVLGLWFDLNIETHTTDLILNQVRVGGHQEVLANAASGRIKVHRTSSESLEESAKLLQVHTDIDIEDAGAYLLARQLKALLLTGDRGLRKLSEALYVEVHGTLWIYDQLVDKGILTKTNAANKLDHLLQLDRYLPKAECETRIKRWRTAS